MESIKSHRDLMTRDKTNAVDSRRPDSGHKGQLAWKSGWMKKHLPPPPTHDQEIKGADSVKATFDTFAPPGVQLLADVGISSFKFGFEHGGQI